MDPLKRLTRSAMERVRSFFPAPVHAGKRELLLGSLGAGLGLFLAEWLSRHALGEVNPWFIAPMGASAVLLFALPASPLAQPWSMAGGNMVSALVGVVCFQWLGAGAAAGAMAVGLAIATMFALRCLHPPGGAVALTAVMGGPAIHQLGYGYAIWPVLANSLPLVLAAIAFNNAAGRRYPHLALPRAQPHVTRDPLPGARLAYTKEDLDAALGSYGETLDIGVDDLEEILTRAHLHAGRRRWGEVRCGDIMSRDVITIQPEDTVDEAWSRLARHKIKAMPVVDADRKLVGIVSLHDFFLKQATHSPRLPVMRSALRVDEIMTRDVRVARPAQPMVDLVEGLSDGGLHHIPVIDEHDRIVGMITQSDVLAALFTSASTADLPKLQRPRAVA